MIKNWKMPPTRTAPHNGAAIRAIREIRGLSTAELARRAGVSSAGLSNIESGSKRVSAELANRIARELCVELGAIQCSHACRDEYPVSEDPEEG